MPLSHEDGAARVYHPVWHGLQEDSQPYFATFLKNFKPHPWWEFCWCQFNKRFLILRTLQNPLLQSPSFGATNIHFVDPSWRLIPFGIMQYAICSHNSCWTHHSWCKKTRLLIKGCLARHHICQTFYTSRLLTKIFFTRKCVNQHFRQFTTKVR